METKSSPKKLSIFFIIACILGCAACCEETMNPQAADVLEGLDKTEVGNTVDIIPNAFPLPGQEKILLRVPSRSQQDPERASLRDQEAKWITIYIASYPRQIQDGSNRYTTHEPLVARLQLGAGGGEGEFEFDIQPPQILGLSPVQGALSATAGDAHHRYGLTVVSFHASAFSLYARSDMNLRTVIPLNNTPADPSGRSLIPNSNIPVTIKAWCAYGVRAAKTRLTKTVVFSQGTNSQHNAGINIQFPIPVGAQSFRIFRGDNLNIDSPRYTVRQQTAQGAFTGDIIQTNIIPVNENPTIPLAPNAAQLILINDGAISVTNGYAEFDINI